jgi:hypothetical protein
MRKVKTLVNVQIPYLFGEVVKVAKVIFYEILIVLVAFGILYCTNFKLSITKNVSIISPIPTVEVK